MGSHHICDMRCWFCDVCALHTDEVPLAGRSPVPSAPSPVGVDFNSCWNWYGSCKGAAGADPSNYILRVSRAQGAPHVEADSIHAQPHGDHLLPGHMGHVLDQPCTSQVLSAAVVHWLDLSLEQLNERLRYASSRDCRLGWCQGQLLRCTAASIVKYLLPPLYKADARFFLL